MIYLKDITANDIKEIIADKFGKDMLKIFKVKTKFDSSDKNDKTILIRTIPKMLNHPFRMWIMPQYDGNGKPNGSVWINNQALKKPHTSSTVIHSISTKNGLKRAIQKDMYKIVVKLEKILEK